MQRQQRGKKIVSENGSMAVSFLESQRRVFTLLTTGASLSRILEALVTMIESQSDGMKCSILLLDEDGKHLRHGAAPSLPEEYNKAVDGLEIGPNVGSCGTAAFRREIVIVQDIWNNPLWASVAEFVKGFNLRACWSSPIISSNGKVLGTFAMYYDEVRAPTSNEIQLIKDATYITLVILEYIRAQEVAKKSLSQLNDAKDALARSEEKYRKLLEQSPEAFVVVNSKSAIEGINTQAQILFCYEASELIGKPIEILIPERFRRTHESYHQQYFKDPKVRQMGAGLDIFARRKDGSEFPVDISLSPVQIEQSLFIIASIRDITEKKRIELKARELFDHEKVARVDAERSVRIRDDFLSVAAHELKTPLTALKMQIQLFDKILTDKIFSEHPKIVPLLRVLRGTFKQLGQLSRLMDDVLNVSKMGAGKLVLDRAEVDLSEIVRTTVERHRDDLAEAQCALTIRGGIPNFGFWDPVRIEQAVVNLLTNAIKYGSGKPIELELNRLECSAEFIIRDYGNGIAKEDQEKIFERFERTTKTKGISGFGLGLYITRQIVQAHGGTISLESELGKGSTFRVQLPLK